MWCDLELEITAGTEPGAYTVSVDSPAGTAAGTIRLDAAALLGRRREMAASVLASALTTRSGLSMLERPVREVGTALFEAVFVERVYGRYTASVQEAGRRGKPLRVVLRLRAPELAGLPWEALYDTEAGEYLCQREPVVRYVETAHPDTPLTVDPPLRILGMVAAPRDLTRLDVAEEQRRLTDAITELAERGRVELVWVPAGNWAALQECLQDGPWHVLHFIGHGGTETDRGGLLALEDETTGRSSLVSATRFARLLHACRPVPRLVVLNACQSGEAAADDLLSSTAAALVHSGISAAVAMQFAVTDPAALAFARGFYRAVAHGTPVDEAVRLGRIAIDGTSEHTLEWVTPVLYLRTNDTRLFSLSTNPNPPPESVGGTPKEPQSADQTTREDTLHGLYTQAVDAAHDQRHADAIALFDRLLSLEPHYRDAAALRDAAHQTHRAAGSYQRARAAEAVGDWDTAIRAYQAVAAIDPGYRDTTARRDACQRARHITGLQDNLRRWAAAQRWDQVVAISDKLASLDPAAADPDHLATNAREQLAQRRRPDVGNLPPVFGGLSTGPTDPQSTIQHPWTVGHGPAAGWPPNSPPVRPASTGAPTTRTPRHPGRKPRRMIWIAVAAVAVVAAAAVGIALTHRSGGIPQSGEIPQSAALPNGTVIVTRNVDGWNDLYPVDSTTGQVGNRLTVDANLVGTGLDDPKQALKSPSPVISPDRKSIVYIVQSDLAHAAIRVMAANGTGDRDLFTTATGCQRYLPPAWNPVRQDELGLACLTVGDPMQFAMRIVKLDGTLVHEFDINDAWVDDLSFSPDGTTLAYFSGDPNDNAGSIFTVPVDGSSRPTNITHATTDRQPAWSPDGSEIVFSRSKSADRTDHVIVVMSADGSDQRVIGEGSGDDVDPNWSPDGKTIIFRSNRNQTNPFAYRYFLIDSNGDNVRLLSPDDQAQAVAEAAWSRR